MQLFDCVDGIDNKCSEEDEINFLYNSEKTKEGLDYLCQHVEGKT